MNRIGGAFQVSIGPFFLRNLGPKHQNEPVNPSKIGFNRPSEIHPSSIPSTLLVRRLSPQILPFRKQRFILNLR